MPIDTYHIQTPQDTEKENLDSSTEPGYQPRPDFELQQHSLNVAPRDLMERDFNEAVMNDEDRLAAEAAWDLQERQRLDPHMFDVMNDEQKAARSQVANVRRESDAQTPDEREARLIAEYRQQIETMTGPQTAAYVHKLSIAEVATRDQFVLAA